MDNPGLKRHIEADVTTGAVRVYEPQYIKVAFRRLAAPPPMARPRTDYNQSRENYPLTEYGDTISRDGEGQMRRDDIETPPPGKGSNTPGPGVDNGAYGSDPWIEEHQNQHSYRSAAFDDTRGEWLYDLDHPDYYDRDPAPSWHADSHQPMVSKKLSEPLYEDHELDDEGNVINHDDVRWSGHARYIAGAPETQYPGEVRTKRPSTSSGEPLDDAAETLQREQSEAAQQRRITLQKGDGTAENPAYDSAQNRVDQRVMQRRLRTAATEVQHQGPSPLDYRSSWGTRPGDQGHPERLGLVDSEAGDPDRSDFGFAERRYKTRVNPDTGRKLKNPREIVEPGAAPGTVAFVDYTKPYPDTLHVNYMKARRDQQGQGHARRLMDELIAAYPDVRVVDFGKEMHPAATALRKSLQSAHPDKLIKGHIYYRPDDTRIRPEAHHNPTEDMHDVLDIQGADGNWNYDPYMHGMFNGMELMRSIHEGDEPNFREAPEEWLVKDASTGLQVKEYEGREGNNDHITRNEQGMVPVDWVRHLNGYRGETPGAHRNYEGSEWEQFKGHVAAGTPGYSSPLFIMVEYGREPRIAEGNHRRDAYVENGATHVPVEIRYFGHSERLGTVGERAMRRQADAMWREANALAIPYEELLRKVALRPRTATPEEDDPRAELEGLIGGLPEAGSPVAQTRPTRQQMDTLAEMGFARYGDPDNNPYWYRRDRDREYLISPQIDGYWQQSSGPHEHWDEYSRNYVMPTAHPTFAEALEGLNAPPRAEPRRPGKSRKFDPHLRDQVVQSPDRRVDPEAMKEPGAHPYPLVNPGLQSFNSTRRTADGRDDPVYPYNPQPHPERDTVDLDNLQSGDDTYSPVRPERSDSRLRQINEVLDQANEGSEEDQRGADASAAGINFLWNLPPGGSLEEHKDAIDKYVQQNRLTHKEHVKALQADWEARGGHKTGEPRPVERFSPRYTKPQRIVPDPNNMFPEPEGVIRYKGNCTNCGQRMWEEEGGSGDPRGVTGDYTYGELDPREFDVPGSDGEQRMHGTPLPICVNCEQTESRYRRVVDKGMGHKAGERDGGFYWQWQRQPDGSQKNVRVDTTHYKDRKGKWHAPGEKPGECPECDRGETGFYSREASVSALHKQSETDDEFWARMEREHPGQQHQQTYLDSLDAARRDFDEDAALDEFDIDSDDLPRNTLLREHAHLLRNGFEWDQDHRYPKYTSQHWRNIVDADGRPAHDQEGHAIERNTHVLYPQFASDSDPHPSPLSYPWMHTYYPAGVHDEEGLVAGHNTAESATRAAHQLALWGARHPESQELLKRYQYVGSEMPYDPDVELPHEAAMESR